MLPLELCLRQCLSLRSGCSAEQDWLVADSLKTVERTKIPLISLKVHDPLLVSQPGDHEPFVRVDISFEAPDHRVS
eukprot:SAG22_NODE_4361_length_1292_cov_2.681475_2_plen_76_part_00